MEGGSIDGDVAFARFDQPAAVAVASDGSIYVGECDGNCVRQIRGGTVDVSTLMHTANVYGLLLDEAVG